MSLTNMSLDNTSHTGRPGLDELVPSRYALRVGEIDVLVVSDGVLSLPGAMLGHNADPAVRAAWLDDMFLPPDVLEWALNVVVVRSGGRTILIDAGLGADPDLHLPQAGRLIHRLEAAGIDLASVTDVVLTHLHMDHIGGLLADGVRDRLMFAGDAGALFTRGWERKVEMVGDVAKKTRQEINTVWIYPPKAERAAALASADPENVTKV